MPSELRRCWLGGRKGIRPVKTEWWGADVVICLERDADLHMAQLMPLPLTVSCFSKIQIGFTFLVPAHPGSPGKRAVKRVCVCLLTRSVIQSDNATLTSLIKILRTFLPTLYLYTGRVRTSAGFWLRVSAPLPPEAKKILKI